MEYSSRSQSSSSGASPKATDNCKKQSHTPKLLSPTSMVTLYAGMGDNKKPFMVHKEFACHYSPVFKAAFNSTMFVEGLSQEYHLEDTTEGALRHLILWMYTQKLDVLQDNEEFFEAVKEEDKQSLRDAKTEDFNLVELCILADKLLIPRLQNQVIDKIEDIHKKSDSVALDTIRTVYEKTAPNNPLRRLMDEQSAMVKHEVFSKEQNYFPKEMLIDLIQLLSRRSYGQKIRVSLFHVNEDSHTEDVGRKRL